MTTATAKTQQFEIHRHRDGEWIGVAYLTADQRANYVRNHGPEGVIRFEELACNSLAVDYDLAPDYQDTPVSELVRLECMYDPA